MASNKKPTRKQKGIIEGNRLKPDNWLIIKNPPGELHIVHRQSGNKRVLKESI